MTTMLSLALLTAGSTPRELGAQRARAQATRVSAEARLSQAVVDSAAAARKSYAAASQAPSAKHALPLLIRSARAWPTQPAYWTAVARIAARLSDAGVLEEALLALSRMHAGASVVGDSAVQRMARMTDHPFVSRLLAQLQGNSAARLNGQIVATLTDTTVFAEGVDADPRTDALYVASIRHRTIYEIGADGRIRDLELTRSDRAGDRIGAVLGVRVAPDGKTLFATIAGLPAMQGFLPSDSALAAIVRVRIADGIIEQRWDVPQDGARHLLGDLAVTADGTVFASDSYAPVLYRLAPGTATLEQIRHPLFRSLQGVTEIPGGTHLIVSDYSHGLLRLDRGANAVTRLRDAPGQSSLGIDGIAWHRGSIIAVQNGIEPARIARFVLDRTHTRIVQVDDLDRQPDVADEPTIGTLWRGGFVYVANSQWEKYDEGRRRQGTVLRPTQLIRVPLTPVSGVAK